jgi:DNA-binding winged helix-turn-helix (wHTH) protein
LLRVDMCAGQLWRGDRVVPLRANAALCCLVENPGVLVTREELCRGECGRYRG